MHRSESLRLLDCMLEGHVFTADDLGAFLEKDVPEDLHLEYKATIDAKELRRCASAFANSAGGVLMVGIVDSTISICGSTPPGSMDSSRWANHCIHPVSTLFSPPPRIHEVQHPSGSVLIVTVARNPILVPLVHAGVPRYYLRMYDETYEAPPYLIADLILGQRSRPDLSLSKAHLSLQ